jgi:hypothetical protein
MILCFLFYPHTYLHPFFLVNTCIVSASWKEKEKLFMFHVQSVCVMEMNKEKKSCSVLMTIWRKMMRIKIIFVILYTFICLYPCTMYFFFLNNVWFFCKIKFMVSKIKLKMRREERRRWKTKEKVEKNE